MTRARYVDVIGEAATAKLERAGLLPTLTETRDGPHVVGGLDAAGVRWYGYPQETRLCTPWAPATPPPSAVTATVKTKA